MLWAFALPLWHLRRSVADGPPPALLGSPTSVSLFGLELVDPLEALGVALSSGPSAKLLWTVLPGALLVLVLGRFFCGWACPYLPLLAASNATRWLLDKLGLRLLDLRMPRSLSVVALIGVLGVGSALGTQLVPLLYPPALISRELFRAVFYGSLGAGALLVALAFAFDTLVSRAGFCRSLCPGGALFSLMSGLSPVLIRRDIPKCTDCTVCDVVCNLGQQPMSDKLDGGCERCGKCIAACPTEALNFGLGVPSLLKGQQELP